MALIATSKDKSCAPYAGFSCTGKAGTARAATWSICVSNCAKDKAAQHEKQKTAADGSSRKENQIDALIKSSFSTKPSLPLDSQLKS